MITCLCCKSKVSTLRCPNPALSGSLFCGLHVRVKNPRLWTVVHKVNERLELIVKIWRGYLVRKRIQLAGPGVLNRSKCINNEDVGTLDEKQTVHPFDYFGFEEDSKLYWGDIRSMIAILGSNLIPVNPYTRNPFSIETRRRLREIYRYRIRSNLQVDLNEKKVDIDLVISDRWLHICQIIYEHEIGELNPNRLVSMSRNDLVQFMTNILEDTHAWALAHKTYASNRYKYYSLVRTGVTKYYEIFDIQRYAYITSTILLFILYDCKNSYDFSFIILSSFYKL
jgi:hypothetical protein